MHIPHAEILQYGAFWEVSIVICNKCGNRLFHVICMKNIGLVELKCSECKHVIEITCVAHTTVTLSTSAVKPEVQ